MKNRIYLYLPVKSWSWILMLLRMGRTVVILNPNRNPWGNKCQQPLL